MLKKLFLSRKAKGFTLIELLVVIAIIGILASIVLASLNSARAKSRDARRVSDVKSIQLALELYFDACGGYPDEAAATFAASMGLTGCTAASTIATYLTVAPTNPTPNGANYVYCSAATPGGACSASATASYTLTFSLEGQTGNLASGAHTASPAGIQ
jgi:prepilin-type N-terminal cleavage/methylation domain-containing protein